MDSRSSNLLNMAMSSLNIDAAKEKRRKIFDANQQAVGNILKVSTNTVGNLQVKPNINGEADSQALQPVKERDFACLLRQFESAGQLLSSCHQIIVLSALMFSML